MSAAASSVPDFASPTFGSPATADLELVERLRAGDASAFESLVRTFGARMLVVARRILGCEAESDDAVQDAFLSALQRLDSFRGDSQLATWLHRIVVNACLMRLRARRRRPTVQLDDVLPKFDETGHYTASVVPWRNSPQDVLCNAESRQQVRRCINELADGHREILLLRDIEGLNTAETAALLGVSESVVKTRLHRARQALRTLLEPLFMEQDD